jgi:hypothetical protein
LTPRIGKTVEQRERIRVSGWDRRHERDAFSGAHTWPGPEPRRDPEQVFAEELPCVLTSSAIGLATRLDVEDLTARRFETACAASILLASGRRRA